MVTVLNTFQNAGTLSQTRDRCTTNVVPIGSIYNSITGTSAPLAYGSYRRILDSKQASYLWRSARNQKRVLGKVNNGVFLDTGGPLWIEEFDLSQPDTVNMSRNRTGGLPPEIFDGPFIVDSNHFGKYKALAVKPAEAQKMLTLTGVSFSQLAMYGTQAIAKSIPTVPDLSIFTILGELREGLASFPGRQTYKMFKESPYWANRIQLAGKSAGSEFLNWIFGIQPTEEDVETLLAFSTEGISAKRLKLHSDFGHEYRRYREVVNTATQTITESAAYPQYTPSINLISNGKLRVVDTTTTRVWFSGSFNHTAWKPTMDAQINALLTRAEDLGLLPNAARLWQLVPYSWLVNWFANTGAFMTNISYLGHSGLLMSYGYVMAETTRTRACTWTGKINNSYYTSTTTSHEKVRQRMKASPYGFGLKVSELSPSQLAILASLGITRTKLLRTGTLSR